MSVVVDHQPLAAAQLGLKTFGQLISHLQKNNRLVVQVLIDGQEPDLREISTLRSSPLDGHTLFVETTEPREMAMDVLADVDNQLDEAERLKTDAVEMLQTNRQTLALSKLAGVFSLWQHVQQSVQKTAELLRFDLALVRVGDRSFQQIIEALGDQLRSIKSSLESRDFVTLADALKYEMETTTADWHAAIEEMRSVVE